ncbi:hypothetical protein [Entomobacter blattae]|uniref:Uncharacterized protein n=1 Tax=Entomobacter blattae TaxID=2762277 RepID=A0A7H1NUS6_9PROT|nr:hypothetical protein [Entomobacter blattae]QNT79536.1 hypothetical protein JGUZn3_23360 [Entomobacter blattae]
MPLKKSCNLPRKTFFYKQKKENLTSIDHKKSSSSSLIALKKIGIYWGYINLSLSIPFAMPKAMAIESSLSHLDNQWYTGSLLSPSGAATQAGGLFLEPYLVYNQPIGRFNASGENTPIHPRYKSLTNYTLVKYAITDNLSVQALPTISHTWVKGGRNGGLQWNDLPIEFQYRILDEDHTENYAPYTRPSLSTFLGIIAPSGNYNNLSRSTAGVGTGAWTLRFGLQSQSAWQLPDERPLRLRLWAVARKPLNSVDLHGVTSYGTNEGYRGNVYPGMFGNGGLSLEYGIDQSWVLAFDAEFTWSKGNRQTGGYYNEPITRTITTASHSWILAPAVEYNWTPNYGIIAGAAITVDGHNTNQTVQPQIAFNAAF